VEGCYLRNPVFANTSFPACQKKTSGLSVGPLKYPREVHHLSAIMFVVDRKALIEEK
jgi:hypothetical protein